MDNLPARSRLVQQALDDAGVASQVRVMPGHVATAAAAAEALGCEVGAIANSLVFTADGAPVLIMVSGAHRADLEVVAAAAGLGPIERATPQLVKASTGQVIGGVAPVGHPEPIRTLVDRALQAYPQLWAGGGTRETMLPLTFDELVRLTGGQVIDVV